MRDDAPITPRVSALSEDTSERLPWERQKGEGEKEWTCFKAYRDMHPRNSLRAGHVGGIRIDNNQLSKWYREWKWAERVEAYDVLTDRIVQQHRKKVLEESAEDISADQMAYLAKLRRVLDLEIGKMLVAAESGNGVGLIKPSDLKGLMEAEVKLIRLIRGESTEVVEVKDGGAHEMDIEELRAWRKRLKEIEDKKNQGLPS